ALEGAFGRVRQGTRELVLVTGSSGIGKSSIIYELHKSIRATCGRFISGKFDQLKRGIPYSALLQALSELIRRLLTEPDAELAVQRQRILDALGGAGRLLCDVLRELVHVLGLPPPVPELFGVESRNRIRLLFHNFVEVFTQHGQPLVLFLDDLQWADSAT